MTYKSRLVFLILLDSIIVSTAIFIAYWLVYPHTQNISANNVLLFTAFSLLILHFIYARMYSLYNKVWMYASVGELIVIVKAVTLTILSAVIIQFFINDFVIYKRAFIVTWMLYVILLGGSRFCWRMVRNQYHTKSSNKKKRTLIVGAGDAGAMIARQLNKDYNESELYPVAFVDDDPTKQHLQIYNLPVIGKVKNIKEIVIQKNIDHIVIAIPSLNNGELTNIINACNETTAQVQMIPKLEDLMTGKVSVHSLKNVEVEDLLGRNQVELDIDSIQHKVTGYTIMVTGAGGSIGSEICRQIMRFSPREILLVGHGEHSIYTIDMELREAKQDDIKIIPIIGDVQDRQRMFDIVKQYRPKKIFHAAAHKHVPLMEVNAHEAVKNNIIGTRNVAEAADKYKVDTFVLVSTDKAVNPMNVMGATKRIAEMIIQSLSKTSDTTFAAVRFGNVLGSRGSVIPLFKKQIDSGGPVTVTDPEMTRYFMTIPEASRLVIQAAVLAKGGEIFVLDMDEPVKIVDLAKNLIRLSGFTVEEIGIEFTGIRPGEKMYEELLNENEVLPAQVYDKIFVGRTTEVDPTYIDMLLAQFNEHEQEELKDQLMTIVFKEKELAIAKGS